MKKHYLFAFSAALLIASGNIVQGKEVAPASSDSEVVQQTSNRTYRQVKGRIVDVNGEPIIGASVLVKGTTTGVITDFEGNYILKPEHDNLGYDSTGEWCAEDGCYEYAYESEYCYEHSDMPYCSNIGCYNQVESTYDEYCYLHTGKDYCIYSTCYNRVDDNADYYCSEHSYLE